MSSKANSRILSGLSATRLESFGLEASFNPCKNLHIFMKAPSRVLYILVIATSIATMRQGLALTSPKIIKHYHARTAMVATKNLFAQFAHPGNDQSDGSSEAKVQSSQRWNRITPAATPAKKRKSRGDSDVSSTTSTPKSSPKKKAKPRTPSTVSFGAVTAANFSKSDQNLPPVHTLLLGTHPSIKSLAESQYFGHPMNAFWWIAGDCLGFRRAEGLKGNGERYGFTSHLRYNESQILPYEQQLQAICLKGFAMWDIVKECERPGSLDQDITKEVPNDIRGFCKLHPSIKRIVFSNGGTGCSFFKKHFEDWLDSGELIPSQHKASQDAFKKWTKTKPKKRNGQQPQIECIVALAVSPAAARYSYEEKRDFWEDYVYKPGLKDFEAAESTIINL